MLIKSKINILNGNAILSFGTFFFAVIIEQKYAQRDNTVKQDYSRYIKQISFSLFLILIENQRYILFLLWWLFSFKCLKYLFPHRHISKMNSTVVLLCWLWILWINKHHQSDSATLTLLLNKTVLLQEKIIITQCKVYLFFNMKMYH